MIDTLETDRPYAGEDRQIGGWRVVVSAWALLLLFLLLLGGVSAVACPRADAGKHRHYAATVIPQHDPCVGAGLHSAPGVDGCKVIPVGRDWADYANYW